MATFSFSFLLVISNATEQNGRVSRSSKFEASSVRTISVEKYAFIMKNRNVSRKFAKDLPTTFTEFTLYCKFI